MKIVLVIPIFDDWESAAMLCALIENAFIALPSYEVTVLLVDDGSFRSDEALRVKRAWTAIRELHILRLRRNMGHQRAIAIGLAWVEQNMPCDYAVVMDGDGEDPPKDIPALLARAAETTSPRIVFAERGRRLEGTVFRVLYLAYRSAHRLITGRGIRFGNFSAIPYAFLRRLTVMSEVWGHYAAAVINARIPYTTVRVDRGSRLTGTTKMNLESLILHGLAAVAVYQTVSVRVLIGSSVLSGLLVLCGVGIVVVRIITGEAFPGGTTTILGICLILICLMTFSSRSALCIYRPCVPPPDERRRPGAGLYLFRGWLRANLSGIRRIKNRRGGIRMNVLVTGGAGYIGSHACKQLCKAGFTPVAYDSLIHGHRSAVRWGPLEVGDIRDEAALDDVFRRYKPAAVLHFAALCYVGESVSQPAPYFETNVAGTIHLLRVMLAHKVKKMVFSSSCATYGIPATLPITEATPQEPVNPYGLTKLIVERVLKTYAEAYGFRAVILRYFNACGADPDGEIGELHDPETHLIPRALIAADQQDAPFELFGTDYPTRDGTCERDYIHVSDLAVAHVAALSYLLDGGSIAAPALNLGTGRGSTNLEVIREIERITGRTVPSASLPAASGRSSGNW